MTLRLHVPLPLAAGSGLVLPDGAARHVQVRRLQPGDALVLFDGRGGEWQARVAAIGRREVRVDLLHFDPVERELAVAVTVAAGMPANERMDILVEKAAELGVAVLQPLQGERSVLRLQGEREARRRAHWQALAEAACEQCGRTRVPRVEPVLGLREWLAGRPAPQGERRWMLSPVAGGGLGARPADGSLLLLSGPEGGLSPDEQAAAGAAGFEPRSLGPRVLRAETAPLAVLAWLGLG